MDFLLGFAACYFMTAALVTGSYIRDQRPVYSLAVVFMSALLWPSFYFRRRG
jgi:hypothetical protein